MHDGIAPVPEESVITLYTQASGHTILGCQACGLSVCQYLAAATIGNADHMQQVSKLLDSAQRSAKEIEILPIPGRTDTNGEPITRVWPPKPRDEE
jgi:hypothetical protein